MVVDTRLADRLQALLADEPGLTTRWMFGGLAFMVDGHLAVCAGSDGELMVRAHPDDLDALLGEPGARPFEMHGRSMAGWLGVGTDAVAADDALARWAAVGTGYARSLPPKAPRPSRSRTSGRRSGGTVAGG
ncbi:TfoX/Sxy family protein [Aquipuribacter hungaricus]|uniref:TfoX/Sxy family protein n=1 Tax=Aquipuribacter hungaricus TaxID=545624 RepID=A0ABV7WJT4_9MICO